MRFFPAVLSTLLLAVFACSSAFAQAPSAPVAAPPRASDVDIWKAIEAISTVVAVVVAGASAFLAWIASRRSGAEAQESAERTIAALKKQVEQQAEANRQAVRAMDQARDSAQKTIDALERQVERQDKARDAEIRMFWGQSVFQLHAAWDKARFLPDKDDPKDWQVVEGGRALALTATAWLGNLLDREVIFSDYFDDYEALYKRIGELKTITDAKGEPILIPRDLLKTSIHVTYDQMKDLKRTKQEESQSGRSILDP